MFPELFQLKLGHFFGTHCIRLELIFRSYRYFDAPISTKCSVSFSTTNQRTSPAVQFSQSGTHKTERDHIFLVNLTAKNRKTSCENSTAGGKCSLADESIMGHLERKRRNRCLKSPRNKKLNQSSQLENSLLSMKCP